MIVDFVCWVAVIILATSFFLALAKKWGWLEWLQVHAPSEFLNKLFNCPFCVSFHASLIISLTLAIATREWWLLAAPICTTVMTKRLW